MTNPPPILPALKAADWAGREHAVCRLLLPTDEGNQTVPWVAYGYDHPHTFEFLTRQNLPGGVTPEQLQLIEHAAIRNLRTLPALWQQQEVTLGRFKKLHMLVCADHFLAAEHILHRDFLLEAHTRLKAEWLAVGIPRRGFLFATNAQQNREALGRFCAAISAQYYRGSSAPISPTVFVVIDGQTVGMIKGQEETGRAFAEAEAQEEAELFLRTMLARHNETGKESLHILAGGPDMDRLGQAVLHIIVTNLGELLKREEFGGMIRVIIIPELTPATPNLPAALQSLEAHLQGVLAELTSQTSSNLPLQVTLQYGLPHPTATEHPG